LALALGSSFIIRIRQLVRGKVLFSTLKFVSQYRRAASEGLASILYTLLVTAGYGLALYQTNALTLEILKDFTILFPRFLGCLTFLAYLSSSSIVLEILQKRLYYWRLWWLIIALLALGVIWL
jgi:hypothetical protein